MTSSYDVGSLPLRAEQNVIRSGARAYQTLLPLINVGDEGGASKVFEDEVVSAFVGKLRAGIDIPNYPQFRDMNEMFFDLIQGIERSGNGYVAVGTPSARQGANIPEVNALKKNVSRISELGGVDMVRMKVCATGPYTLSSFFRVKDARLVEDLGRAIARIVTNTIFQTRRAEVSLLFVDEPVFGFLNDPLLDYGQEGRTALLNAWREIFRAASARGVETGIHLHNTSDNLYWEVEELGIVESHVDDPLYASEATKQMLIETDKQLKASIGVTLFDSLIASKLASTGSRGDLQQRVGETWSEIRRGTIDPFTFLEETELMLRRLRDIKQRFGSEHVTYAGPECGLWSFPNYECALECLRRISEVLVEYDSENSE